MTGDASSDAASRARVPFFGRFRGLQIVAAVLTFGLWLLAPLSVWLWRTGRRRSGAVVGAIFGLIAISVIAAIAGGSPKKTAKANPQKADTAKVTRVDHTADDAHAKAAVEEALKVIGREYQDFGDYGLISSFTLGNLDHHLRSVAGLKASGHGATFDLSVRSASGMTFAVHGDHLRLTRTCAPAGTACSAGTWRGATKLVLPKVPVVTAAAKAKVRAALTASVDHYAQLLALGQRALGSSQYADANAGLAAFSDPNSAASRFRDYRTTANPEGDLSFLGAFKRADSVYTAANEPNSISTWRDDMDNAQSDLSTWVTLAAGWQIREHASAQLQAAAHKVDADLAKARRDLANVLAGK
jgi:hypothetical protein